MRTLATGSLTLLLLCFVRTPATGSPTFLLTHSVRAPATRSLALLSFCLVLGLAPFYFRSPTLRTFKQSLSDEHWPHLSTRIIQFLYLFPLFGLYNLTNNTKRKRTFYDKAFINSCPFTGNHTQKEFDLSFVGCWCLTTVNLNQSW